LGLSKQQLEEEKNSKRLQRLQRLGHLSAAIECERKETKDLLGGIEDVSNSLGMEHKVSRRASIILVSAHSFVVMMQSCNLLANFSSDGYVVPWLRHPGE
jgi:hypothetical protein